MDVPGNDEDSSSGWESCAMRDGAAQVSGLRAEREWGSQLGDEECYLWKRSQSLKIVHTYFCGGRKTTCHYSTVRYIPLFSSSPGVCA